MHGLKTKVTANSRNGWQVSVVPIVERACDADPAGRLSALTAENLRAAVAYGSDSAAHQQSFGWVSPAKRDGIR